MNVDEMYEMALANRQTNMPIDVMRDGSEVVSAREADGSLRIDIYGVADQTRDEQVTAPPPGMMAPMAAPTAAPGMTQQMVEEMFAGGYPGGAAPMSARQFLETAADVPAGLVKGAIQGTIGLPGDIESLTYGVREILNRGAGESALDAFINGLEQKTILPTTENVKQWLDTNVGPLVPVGADPRRVEAAKTAEFVGELGGAGQTIIEGTRAAARGARQIGQEILTEAPVGAVKLAQEAVPFVMTNATPKRMTQVQKIVDQGIAQNMSATKILQAVESRTAQKVTGAQAKEIKQYIFDKTPKGQIFSDQAFKDLVAQPFPMEPSTANFANSFNAAMDWLNTLDANGL